MPRTLWLKFGTVAGSRTHRMDQHTLLLAAVPVTGFVAGSINTLAGSGSLLTLPILILLGLPANVANGTNRVGVLLQNIVAVETFRRRGALPLAGSWKLLALIVPSVVGGVIGAQLAVDLDEQLLRRTIGVLMIVLIVVMLLKPERWIAEHVAPRDPRLLVLGAGQAVGAWTAAHFAVSRGAEFVRWAVVAITVGSAVALFAGL